MKINDIVIVAADIAVVLVAHCHLCEQSLSVCVRHLLICSSLK